MKKLIVTIGLVTGLMASNLNGINSQDLCYKSRNYPISYDIAFESMKQALMNANMHLKDISKEDGFISATGTKKYDDSVYNFTFTISFDKKGDITNIKTLVSYDRLENTSEIKSVSQLNIPIPIPWSKVFKYKGTTNVEDPQFFDSFYINFDLVAFEYQMKKLAVHIDKTKDDNLLKDMQISEESNNTNEEN
jgi:hypothetical protein